MSKFPSFIADADIKALIFDCDGTLADTFPAHYRAFKEALSFYNLNFEPDFYAQRLGFSRYQLLDALSDATGYVFDEAAKQDLKDRTPPLFLEHIDAILPIAFTGDIVRAYHGNVPMGVASGGVHVAVTASLKAIGIADLFDTIVTIEDAGKGKPHPYLYLKAADNLKVDPKFVQTFEDSDEGMEAALRAGMRVLDIRPYYQYDISRW